MKILKNDINLRDTLLSGQCFRVIEEENHSFTVILEDRVVNIKETKKYLNVKSNKLDNLKEVVINFLDLKRPYEEINKYLIFRDEEIKEIVSLCKGYKILNQPKLEIMISYIISQNNSVKNISRSIEKISSHYGKKVKFNDKEYFLFPELKNIIDLKEDDFRKLGVGFRAKYLVNILDKLKKDEYFLTKINKFSTEKAMKRLMEIKGIGMKVASCILMFSYGRLDVFPIDTWVKKYYNNKDEKEIKKITFTKYGLYSGLAIQYIFHYERNKKDSSKRSSETLETIL